MRKRVAIVGAGLAGLTAASQLADENIDVTVLERAVEPGGRAGTMLQGRYRFNLGPHALYVSGEAYTILAELGVELTGHAPVQGKAQALRGGELHTLPVGAGSLLATDLIGWREKVRLGSVLARIARIDPDLYVGTTVRQWAESVSNDPTTVELLLATMRLTTYANAPDLACAGASLRQLQRGFSPGVVYLDGGWGRLVAQLVDRAMAAGVRFVRRKVTTVDELFDDFDSVVLAVGGPSLTDALTASTNPSTPRFMLPRLILPLPVTAWSASPGT